MSSVVFNSVLFLVAFFFINIQVATEFHHDRIHVITVHDGRLECDSEEVVIKGKDEKNGGTIYSQLQKSRRPPKRAILRLKVIFNKGWVKSSTRGCRNTGCPTMDVGCRGCKKYARRQVRRLVNETEYIFSQKFSVNNRLPTAFKIEIEKGIVYDKRRDANWQASTTYLRNHYAIQRHVRRTNSTTTHHYVFLAGQDNVGPNGIANTRTACSNKPNKQRWKISITEWYNDISSTAGILAHEIGHALGMKHDFGPGGRHDIRFDRKGRLCTYQNGVMDYGLLKRKDKFSSCSKDDYVHFYRQGGLFCF